MAVDNQLIILDNLIIGDTTPVKYTERARAQSRRRMLDRPRTR